VSYVALNKEEIKKVINGQGVAQRVPVILQFWNDPKAFGENAGLVKEMIDTFPMDVETIPFNMPKIFEAPKDDPEYRWLCFDMPEELENVAIDSCSYLSDWDRLDEVIEKFPKASYPNLFHKKEIENSKYVLCNWWYCLFERHWSLRGMENALTDFYIYPEETHRLYRAITDFYKGIIARAGKELNADGIFVSDDIGTQTGPFFSVDIFKEFFKPYYKELFDTAHKNNMHFWLHTCGNIKEFLPELIEIGLDVIHPIQKYTMDEKEIAEKFGDKICIWAGFDVQQIIPYKTAEDVRKEVHFMMDTYYRKDGRFMITAGNGITGDCPIDSLKALYEECFDYGSKIGSLRK
jgi:uroporphyrinogen decarboxylase